MNGLGASDSRASTSRGPGFPLAGGHVPNCSTNGGSFGFRMQGAVNLLNDRGNSCGLKVIHMFHEPEMVILVVFAVTSLCSVCLLVSKAQSSRSDLEVMFGAGTAEALGCPKAKHSWQQQQDLDPPM